MSPPTSPLHKGLAGGSPDRLPDVNRDESEYDPNAIEMHYPTDEEDESKRPRRKNKIVGDYGYLKNSNKRDKSESPPDGPPLPPGTSNVFRTSTSNPQQGIVQRPTATKAITSSPSSPPGTQVGHAETPPWVPSPLPRSPSVMSLPSVTDERSQTDLSHRERPSSSHGASSSSFAGALSGGSLRDNTLSTEHSSPPRVPDQSPPAKRRRSSVVKGLDKDPLQMPKAKSVDTKNEGMDPAEANATTSPVLEEDRGYRRLQNKVNERGWREEDR